MPRLTPLLSHLLHTGAWLVLGVGVAFQALLQDRIPWLALFFYALPKPCLAAMALTLCVWPKASIKSRLLALSLALFVSGWWWQASWRSGPQTPRRAGAEEVRVLFWNLARPTGLHQGMIEMVNELQPHIAAFVEPGRHIEPLLRDYEARLPGYQAAWMPRGILWLSRTPSRYRERGKLEGTGAFARFDVSGLGPTFPVVVADVFQHPFHSRKGQLDEVLGHSLERTDALLAGDFNTPLESVHFTPYRARFTNALEAAEHGFLETWPHGLPLLSLDQVWAGPDWQIVEARKIWRTEHSDHAAIFVILQRK